MKDDSAMLQWILLLLEASKKVGRDLNVSATYKEQLERVGYTDIVEKIYVWPMNKWPKNPKFKELGMCMTDKKRRIKPNRCIGRVWRADANDGRDVDV